MKRFSSAIPVRVAAALSMTLIALVVVRPHAQGASASPATAARRAPARPSAADPTVSRPVLPSSGIQPATLATTFPLSEVGYEQSEHFLSGTATSYVPSDYPACLPSCTSGPSDGQWSVVPHSTAPYTTRVVVYRPINPRKFNGTVVVEWLNVSGGLDDAPDWVLSHNELVRDGFAWVGVSAQAVGVNQLKCPAALPLPTTCVAPGDPVRYASLSQPGDSYSYDIFSQAGQAVWDNAAQMLGGLTPRHVIAAGESQSASRLTTYIDAVAPLVNVYDGYLVHSRSASGAPLSQAPEAPSVIDPTPTQFRSDLRVPVFEFETETDVAGSQLFDRQHNTNLFRLWEVAGSSHFDDYGLVIGPGDTGNGQGAVSNLAAMQNPPSTVSGFTCNDPINTGETHWNLNAAFWWLNQWVVHRTQPPIPPLLQVKTTPGEPVVFALDNNGNVLGGVRSPQVDAPIATLSGVGNSGATGTSAAFCGLFGRTLPFSASQLAGLYPTHFQFVFKSDAATLKDVLRGYILLPDAVELDHSALVSDIG